MLTSARNPYPRLRRRVGGEKGISTIEWIGLTAVVLVFLGAINVYVQVHGGEVGAAAGSSMDEQNTLWMEGGGSTSPYGTPGVLGAIDIAARGPGRWRCPGEVEKKWPTLEWKDRAIELMRQTSKGQDILELVDSSDIPIEFGESDGLCEYQLPGFPGSAVQKGKIVIGHLAQDATLEDLARCLVHEGTHARDRMELSLKSEGKEMGFALAAFYFLGTGQWQEFSDTLTLWDALTYVYSEEYDAVKAEAEFWKQLKEDDWDSLPDEDVIWLVLERDGQERNETDAKLGIELSWMEYIVWLRTNCR